MQRFAVLGAGSWGTALALVLARNGHVVRLWGHDATRMAAIARARRNARYLPEASLPEAVRPTADLDTALADVDAVLVAVPSVAFGGVVGRLAGRLPPGAGLAWATKGLDADSGGLLHQLARRYLPEPPLAVLSGPSFAAEVASGLPTAVSLAATDGAWAERLAGAFHDERFRVYTSTDVIGVELGGAVKNVLAIATGIADGLGFGANARAGLITRGLAEVRRLGRALGAADHTLTGLAGMGDLILTCTDDQSRNRRLGLALGRGESLEDAVAAIGQVVEGVRTASELHRLAAERRVELPICAQVHGVVAEGLSPADAARNLMHRAPKAEFE